MNDLNGVIHDSVILFQDAHKEIEFDFQQGADIPILMLDPEQIRRVMVNLLDNAVAAVGGKKGRIEIRTSRNGNGKTARVDVADNGCGIPPGYHVKMFEPYFSTKRSGTGLGLAIVNSIMADHHGQVSVADNNPCGTIVTFELPIPDNA
jgi:two-component system nitrogen regulation sensor histidine kinase NtrY